MLDLSLPQKTNGGFIGITPELARSKIQRVPELDHWVQLLSSSFEIIHCLHTCGCTVGSWSELAGGTYHCTSWAERSCWADRFKELRKCLWRLLALRISLEDAGQIAFCPHVVSNLLHLFLERCVSQQLGKLWPIPVVLQHCTDFR